VRYIEKSEKLKIHFHPVARQRPPRQVRMRQQSAG
jgi:hypothetical protein